MTGGYESNEQSGTRLPGTAGAGGLTGPDTVSPQPQPGPSGLGTPAEPVTVQAPVPGPFPPMLGPGFAAPIPPAAPAPTGNRRGGWPGLVAFVLAIVLVLLAGFQAYQISQLSDRLDETRHQLAEAQAGDRARLDALEGRTGALEQAAGKLFNSEEIAAAVLPSVFRVRAGNFFGTAFAVGKPAAGGGTNLFTNYHVVEEVWESGEREVFLERTTQRFPATIVGVDKDNDVAHLTTDAKFDGLVTASAPVKSGQQIIVVGAPLGLEDSVTTGIVSAERELPGFPGTMIQIDASINPGNSGGPVINGDKQVVGIATAKRADAEGIGLAVPIQTACVKFHIC